MKIKEYEDTSKNALARKIQTTYAAKLDKSSTQLVMDMLAKLYSEPYSAALREYVSNAYDANIEAGATKPVEVHLPEVNEPYLSVRDFGKGLDYLGIVSVFANFGTSTKRDSDDLIGGFGIGSKSGLAISDSIHVTSICNGLLNEFVLERTPNGIFTRFTKENEDTSKDSGTTITIDLSDKIEDAWDESQSYSAFKPEITLCGWSKNEVLVTNTKYEDVNEHRVVDEWYFNGHEYKHPLIHQRNNISGFLIGKVFYGLPAYGSHKVITKIESPSLIIPFDIKDIKVTYSREQIDFTDTDTCARIKNAMEFANARTEDEYSSIVNDDSLQPYEKIRKLGNTGIHPAYLSNSFQKVTKFLDRTIDEPAVLVKIAINPINATNQVTISTNKVNFDDEVDMLLTFDSELPKRPMLKQFISWLQNNSDDTLKDIKDALNKCGFIHTIATTTKGYAKMYYTNNTQCFNVQAAYDIFIPKDKKGIVDLSNHEFTYYDNWNNKHKTKINAAWFMNKKVVILQPKAKYSANIHAIIAISKLLVPDPRTQWSDIEFVATKTKKEYNYLTNLAPNVPTITVDKIVTFVNIVNNWKKDHNITDTKTIAYFFQYLMMTNDKHLVNSLWRKTPFANQRYIERKICCITNCFSDWHELNYKDLVTRAYYNYANKHCGNMKVKDIEEIIAHISTTCAPEITKLQSMCDDLDKFVK